MLAKDVSRSRIQDYFHFRVTPHRLSSEFGAIDDVRLVGRPLTNGHFGRFTQHLVTQFPVMDLPSLPFFAPISFEYPKMPCRYGHEAKEFVRYNNRWKLKD